MFTGIIEAIGRVNHLQRGESETRLDIESRQLSAQAKLGESIAVNGCCLTVSSKEKDLITFDLLNETLARTNLGALQPGSLVNLEQALPAHGRLGGHFLQGHVDCTSAVRVFEKQGADYRLVIQLPPSFSKYIIQKGSIAINGISLTVAELAEEEFTVWIIPHTLAMTNLQALKENDRVNLEFDLIAKYIERLLNARDPETTKLPPV
jgi:riboflavin synthase